MNNLLEEADKIIREAYDLGKKESKTKLEGLIQFSLDVEDNNKGKTTAQILNLMRMEMIKRIMD